MFGFSFKTKAFLGLTLLISVTSAAISCSPRTWVRSKVYPELTNDDLGWAVAVAPSEELAVDRCLTDGQEYCLHRGKSYQRLDKIAFYQGQDRTERAPEIVMRTALGDYWKDYSDRNAFHVEIQFRCQDPK